MNVYRYLVASGNTDDLKAADELKEVFSPSSKGQYVREGVYERPTVCEPDLVEAAERLKNLQNEDQSKEDQPKEQHKATSP